MITETAVFWLHVALMLCAGVFAELIARCLS